jgi:serine/threonine protein kinase
MRSCMCAHNSLNCQIPVDHEKKLVLDEMSKLDIIMGICGALVYMHSSKREKGSEFSDSYSHRDLKPENIMYQDGVAKLIDFGVAIVSKHSTQRMLLTLKNCDMLHRYTRHERAGHIHLDEPGAGAVRR